MDNHVLAKNLRALRLARNMTQAELGRLADVGRNTVASLETGRVESPGVFLAIRIANALNVSVERLVGHSPAGEFPTLLDAQTELERRLPVVDSEPFKEMTPEEFQSYAGDIGLSLDEIDHAALRAIALMNGAGELSSHWLAYSYYSAGALAATLRNRN